eukprot:6149229-Heterocapsa_arctica.AAC.1
MMLLTNLENLSDRAKEAHYFLVDTTKSVMIKTIDEKNYRKSDLKTNDVMNTTPAIMGSAQITMTTVRSEMYDKYLLAKSDRT